MTNEKTRVCYTCEICDFMSYNKTDYERHLTRRKHDENVKNYEKTLTKPDPNACPSCHKIFKHKTSVYKHKTVCPGHPHPPTPAALPHVISPSSTTTPCATKQYLHDVIIKNQELTSAMMILIQQNTELQSKMMELCINNTNSNNTNSNNTITNCHNPTFNMNLFLNEKCKDAMNMKDFVNSIQLNITDLENVGRLGYVEGMSNIFIDNLQKTDVYKRPVHCSDVKRETLYVKDNNKWEREGPDHQKMVNAVLAVEQKNIGLLGEWVGEHPKCMNSNSQDNTQYFKLSKTITDGETDGNIAKVVKRVAKNVIIDKE
jgi:hypothetical protein